MKRVLRATTLFALMYSVTTTVVWVETGNLVMGLKIAVFTATIKTILAIAHHWAWDRLEHTKLTGAEIKQAAVEAITDCAEHCPCI